MSAPIEDGVSFYSRIAADFHASYVADPNRIDRVRVWQQFLDRYALNARFAYDIGCGSGVLACELAGRGVETVGIDGAEGMLAIAQSSAQARGLTNLSFRHSRLPPADTADLRSADLVISSSAIEYLESIPEALCFVRNLLVDSGVVIFSLSNRDSISRIMVRAVHRLTGRPRYLDYLRHFITVEEIKSALASAGLTYVEHAYFAGADRLNRLLRLCLPERFSNNMIIVVARKPSAIADVALQRFPSRTYR
jgi:2-polyprenyl-3-methyl-5-hydroxy-6-metoxy-1,4-benzoquinol methylase